MEHAEECELEPEQERGRDETILVEESPMPTRSAKLMSSESHRRMNQSMRARRRGGQRRHGVHRRHVTLIHDPTTPNHCGFECILRAAGVKVTTKAIQVLRDKTAQRVYTAYINDHVIHGLRTRDMVQDTDETLGQAKVEYVGCPTGTLSSGRCLRSGCCPVGGTWTTHTWAEAKACCAPSQWTLYIA